MEHIYRQPQFGENWFTYPNLYSRFVRMLGDGSTIVEVGSWKGKSTAYLAVEIINSGKRIQLHAVDTWEGSSEHADHDVIKNKLLYETFLTNISPVISVVKPVRKRSVDAAKDYPDNSIDVVFIDACHDYECVKADIESWYPKIKSGGIISGHDCDWPGVERAFREAFPIEKTEITEYCWVHKVL